MMHLFLIRHAKSSWTDETLDDLDRPLNKRGRKQAGFMASSIRNSGAFEAVLYCSPARRARDTLGFLLNHAGLAHLTPDIQTDEALYTFDVDDLWHWLTEAEHTPDLTLVGHNPALLELVNRLLPNPLESLPTCALVELSLPIDSWSAAVPGCARLDGHLIPAWVDYQTFRKQRPLQPSALHDRSLYKRTRALLCYQADLIAALEPGVRLGTDPEFLHQYRVNLRRSRSIGQALLRLHGNKSLKRHLKLLQKEAQATSDLRDLDVLLMRIRDWETDPDCQSALAGMKLFDTFRAQRDRRHQALVEHLDSQDHRARMAGWSTFLDSRHLKKVSQTVTPASVKTAVEELVGEHDRQLTLLTTVSPDAELHELRKLLKKLRYLLELVVDPKCDRMKGLKARQKRIGIFQDLTVQLCYLKAFQAERKTATAPGFQQLLDNLTQAKAKARQAILELPPFGEIPMDPGQ